jgi:misacylated tRNA(Ala) deacylase
MEQVELNAHNKAEHPPMHTAEHILNQTMVRMFGCSRAVNAHIERKKSKCDYLLEEAPSDEQIQAVEAMVNETIALKLPIHIEFVTQDSIPAGVEVHKLPEDVSETIRLIKVGDYDTCACIGAHVGNTSEIGEFKIISHDYADGRLRLRFKLQ